MKGLVRVGVSAVLSAAAVALAVAACRGGEDRIAQPSAPSPGVAVAGTVHLDMGDNFFSYQGQRNPTIVIKATLNALVLRPRLGHRPSGSLPRGRLQLLPYQLLALEAALGIAVLLVVGLLVQLVPARVEAQSQAGTRSQNLAQPFDRIMQTTQGEAVRLTIAPNTVGTNTFEVRLLPGPDTRPVEAAEVRLLLESPSGQGKEVIMQSTDVAGTYRATGPFSQEPGRWQVKVQARRPEGGELSAVFPVAVAGARLTANRAPLAFPLAAGNWASVGAAGMILFPLLLLLWWGHLPQGRRSLRRGSAACALAVFAAGLGLLLGSARLPSPEASSFSAQVALRYQTADGRFVLLEIEPYQVGENRLRVTVLNEQELPVQVAGVTLRFSRLEQGGARGLAMATPASNGLSYLARFTFDESGWWAIDVLVDDRHAVSFYLRLDEPSQAPLAFAPPDYQSDPTAEALFKRAFERYQSLSALKWREELTSGLLAPSGIGAWVVTDGEAEAPGRLLLRLLLHLLPPWLLSPAPARCRP